MNARRRFTNTLYIAWTIGWKDIVDTLKNRNTLTNLIVILALVGFFYWLGYLRPFDKGASVVVYDDGDSGLVFDNARLGDGSTYSFRQTNSRQEMLAGMPHRDLGLVIPANFNQTLASGSEPVLSGYIYWSQRTQSAALAAKYTRAFTELLGQPVQVNLEVVIPQPNKLGMPTTAAANMVLFIFGVAIFLVPQLMLEEKQTRTLDALLVSPASPGQVVLGKALAGLFYTVLVGGLAFGLNWFYITNWALAMVAFLGFALLATGVALALGSFIPSQQKVLLWTVPVILFLVVPPLFYMEPSLKAGLRAVMTWLPTPALVSLYRFASSTGASPAQVWQNLAVVLVSIVVVFALVVWQVRRTDR